MTTIPQAQTDVLRLHYNENTAGCSPAVIAALRSLTPSDVSTYPDYAAITDRVARWLQAPPDAVVLTNGLDEGLYAVAQLGVQGRHEASPDTSERAIVAEGHEVAPCEFIQVDPTFEMFEEFTRIVRATLVRIAPDDDFAFPLQRVLDAIRPETRVVYLVDPNNPTGLPLPAGAVEAVAEAAPHAMVLVDEAYADFSGRTSIDAALSRHANLVIGRTFAKGHGLAGLRVGALVAQPATLARLCTVLPPFNVNVAAVKALEAALDDDAYLRWSVAQAAESRARIEAFCTRHQLQYWPSQGNFVLVRVGDRAGAIASALASRGILLRDKSAAPGCRGCLRITAGTKAHTTATLAALEETLASRTN